MPGYKVVQPVGRQRSRFLADAPAILIREVTEGGEDITTAFRRAAKCAGWPFGLVLEPVAHEVVGA